jgi:hypothetical protein
MVRSRFDDYWPREPDKDATIAERCAGLIKAITRWQAGISAGTITFPSTLSSGIVLKTATSLEELIWLSVETLLRKSTRQQKPSAMQDKAGFGDRIRELKRVLAADEGLLPSALVEARVRPLNLLDKLVRMRNDCTHRRLHEDDKRTVVTFIGYAKEFCESELMRLIIELESNEK